MSCREVGKPHWFLEVSHHSEITSVWPVPLLDVQRELCVCSHSTKVHLDEPMCVWVWGLTAQRLLLKYHGQRLFEAVGICWMPWANHCQELLAADSPELLVRHSSEQKIQVPKSFTCLLNVLCFDVELPENGIGVLFFYFTATYRTIFFQ